MVTPSFLDFAVNASTSAVVSMGTYDAYDLNLEGDFWIASPYSNILYKSGRYLDDFTSIGVSGVDQNKVNSILWILAQDFTNDPKFSGQYNFGEVQTAIYNILGRSNIAIAASGIERFLSDNYRNVVSSSDSGFLVAAAVSAASLVPAAVPVSNYSTAILAINNTTNSGRLITQLRRAKISGRVWTGTNHNGLEDNGESGLNGVTVELYDSLDHLIASTPTGDDLSTSSIETRYYEFIGLENSSYYVKFSTPTGMHLATKDVGGNSSDITDSDANASTGETDLVVIAHHLQKGTDLSAGMY